VRQGPQQADLRQEEQPLVIGLGKGENYIASDIPAIINKTRDTYILSDGEMAVVEADKVTVKDLNGKKINKEVFRVNWDAEAAEKGGFEHFMLKEIYEQPKAVRDTLRGRVSRDSDKVTFNELNWTAETFKDLKKIFIVACGTAYHAGIVGKYYIEKMARIPVEVDIASEFRYRDPIIRRTLHVHCGEPERRDQRYPGSPEGSPTAGGQDHGRDQRWVPPSPGSRPGGIHLRRPGIAVASTKAYTTQLIVMLLLSMYISHLVGKLSDERLHELIQAVLAVPERMHDILDHVDQIKVYANNYANRKTPSSWAGAWTMPWLWKVP
jgi:glutamine---fructose-6-phosphate transaminase (isomerizing)